jgi:hypothetical protein
MKVVKARRAFWKTVAQLKKSRAPGFQGRRTNSEYKSQGASRLRMGPREIPPRAGRNAGLRDDAGDRLCPSRNRANLRLTERQKTNMARASHPGHIVTWVSSFANPPPGATGRWRQPDSAHDECHFCQRWLQPCGSEKRATTTTADGQQPNLLKEQVLEAAMPGQPVCARALSNFPRQFTLENCRQPPASPQTLFGNHLRIATYSLDSL